jgi:hypothetical protein
VGAAAEALGVTVALKLDLNLSAEIAQPEREAKHIAIVAASQTIIPANTTGPWHRPHVSRTSKEGEAWQLGADATRGFEIRLSSSVLESARQRGNTAALV